MKYLLKVKNLIKKMSVKSLITIKLKIKISVRSNKFYRIQIIQEFIIQKTSKLNQMFLATISMNWLRKNNYNDYYFC